MRNSFILRDLCQPFVNIFCLSEGDIFFKDTTGKHPHLDLRNKISNSEHLGKLAGGWGKILPVAAGFLAP